MKSLRERSRNHIPSFGMTIGMQDPTLIEMAAKVGYDFVRIDCEHTFFDTKVLIEMLRTARLLQMPCHIRVDSLSATNMNSLLGMGVAGIVVPSVEDQETVLEAVSLVKYPPYGKRGADGVTRLIRYGGMSREEYIEFEKNNLDLIIQIETVTGLEHMEELVSLDGFDMVASGRNDIAQSMGMPGQKNHPDVLAVEEKLIHCAVAHNKQIMVAADGPERVKQLMEIGAYNFIVGRDELLAEKSIKHNLARFDEIRK